MALLTPVESPFNLVCRLSDEESLCLGLNYRMWTWIDGDITFFLLIVFQFYCQEQQTQSRKQESKIFIFIHKIKLQKHPKCNSKLLLMRVELVFLIENSVIAMKSRISYSQAAGNVRPTKLGDNVSVYISMPAPQR